jgi:hypothetical protein
MHLGPFGLNRLPNLHLELFLGQCPVADLTRGLRC